MQGATNYNGGPANTNDIYYQGGIGAGGAGRSDGQNGMVVFLAYTGEPEAIVSSFFYKELFGSGARQTYIVPVSLSMDHIVEYVDVKVWGAGGGGSDGMLGIQTTLLLPSYHLQIILPSHLYIAIGGGGAFSQMRLAVTAGETLTVYVGGGGKKGIGNIGGAGGFNGGGRGGDGEMAGK